MSTPEEELQNINRRLAQTNIPAMIYVVLCMVVGLIGNVPVILFYGFKVRATPTYMLIVTLAVYDVTTCLTLMPFHLFELNQQYSFSNDGFCRLAIFLSHFLSFGAIFLLLTIAIDRYRKICKPFGNQISVKTCRYIIFFVTVLAVILTAPSMAIHGVEEVTRRSNGHNVTGHVCAPFSDEIYQKYIIALNGFLYVLFIASILTLIILYALIRKRLFSRPNLKSQNAKSAKKQSNTTQGSTNMNHHPKCEPTDSSSLDTQDDKNNSNTMTEDETKLSTDETKLSADETKLPNSKDTDTRSKEATDRKRQTQQSSNNRKYTILMLSITVAFILSCLPYLALFAAAIIFGTRWIADSRVAYVFYTIAVRSFLVNSACNPIIYGFLNTEFRRFVFSCLCHFCKSAKRKEARPSDDEKSSSTTITRV